MERAVQRSICFTRFLVEKDCLAAAMTRLGNGFSPPTVLSEARYHLVRVQDLVKQMEEIEMQPKPSVTTRQKSCCGRGD